ncbi:hypothetical protein RUM44_012790 [Polyplax serrata]|uniref:Uncharacterized protein n=1 Tax=Polyplax serrata TaxID=468196 RepID=A0ABR1BE80_POLSC
MQGSSEENDGKPEGPLNSSRICRFCLSPAGVMSPIFEQGEINSLPLSSKIMAFISIQVYVNDGLPSLICHRCLYQVEKSYDFKTQCEASDAMLRKYLSALQASCSPRGSLAIEGSENLAQSHDSLSLIQFQKNVLNNSSFSDSPFKRKRGRPRKEENMMFYSSPLNSHLDFSNGLKNYADDEIKIVDGIESVVTVVDPRSEILSNSDDENKVENEIETENIDDSDKNEALTKNNEMLDSLEIAKAKAKKYMGVLIGVDENGLRTRRHLCKGCGKTFGHCSDLRKHVLVHTGERPFHCRVCTKTFSRSTNLNKHMKVHTGQKPYFCTDCPKSFATKGDLQRHLIIHSGIKPFGCQLCNQCFSRKDKLTRHLKLHNNGGLSKLNFKCALCSVAYHTKLDLEQHVESVHSQDVKNEEEYEEERTKSNFTPITQVGNRSFVQDMDSSNRNDVIKQEKDDSSQEIDDGQEVESMVINIDPFPVESDINDVPGSWETNKSRSSDSLKSDDCKSVEYTTKKESCEKPTFQCKICYKRFSEVAYLRSHMVTHSRVKPHKCTMCDKSFTRRRELLRHENVHTGFKPFKCNTCGKAFSRKDKLVRHEKIHNGVKKFPCTICPNLSFVKIEDLIVHHRSVHSDSELPYVLPTNPQSGIRYQCETCFVCYGNLKMYQEHLKTHDEKSSGEKMANGVECDSDAGNSEDEKVANTSLEQLSSNPAITVTSISKTASW